MIGYYLGDPVEVLGDYNDGWIGTRFVEDRKQKVWRMWAAQVKAAPWGESCTNPDRQQDVLTHEDEEAILRAASPRCEECNGAGVLGEWPDLRPCKPCGSAGVILKPLPPGYRPRCGGCGHFLRRDRWGWPINCWDCGE